MKVEDLKRLPTELLIEKYREASESHGRLLNARDTKAANKEYGLAAAIRSELSARGPEAQPQVLKLLGDPEPGTRYWAATASLRFSPEAAERVLAELARPPMTLVGLSAAMTLEQWKSGAYKPDASS